MSSPAACGRLLQTWEVRNAGSSVNHCPPGDAQVKIFAWLAGVVAHDDPLTAACNRIAHLVAWNQPLYPLYLWWLVGGDWWVGCWTFLSTPLFAGVPFVARRHPLAGRALLPLTGVANGLLSVKAFGAASGVALFLIPCAVIAVLGFRGREWRVTLALIGITFAASRANGVLGPSLGHFTVSQYSHFVHLNLYSVATLSIVAVWTLIRARTAPRID